MKIAVDPLIAALACFVCPIKSHSDDILRHIRPDIDRSFSKINTHNTSSAYLLILYKGNNVHQHMTLSGIYGKLVELTIIITSGNLM